MSASPALFPSRSCAADADAVRLSVIVPFAPDERAGDVLLAQLAALPAGCEVMLVRAGAGPRRSPPADGRGVVFRECLTLAGRARQMNAGAAAARGAWLWFLHADSRLTDTTLAALFAFLAHGEDALGYFDLRFDDGPWLARLNAWCANRRARWLGLPFGDQGLVLPAAAFVRLGGYSETAAYGEDHLLVWRARAMKLPLRRLAAPLGSSARKYAAQGWARTTWQHVRCTAAQAWPQWRALRRQRRHERLARRGSLTGAGR
jgi:rSAM/selenodomain-associated transferase 2